MMNMTMNVSDKVVIDDNFRGTIIAGRVEIEDQFGNLVLEKNNLVVLQGRGFVLKKLFSHPTNNLLDADKKIVGPGNVDFPVKTNTIPALFTVGNAGTNGVESPVAFVPKYDDKTINSLFESGVDILGDGTNKGKRFSSVQYVNDSNTNETYVLLSLSISSADFGNKSVAINEAGILFGDATFANDKISAVTSLKLMSRLTFDSIPINAGDSFTIRYYLYA